MIIFVWLDCVVFWCVSDQERTAQLLPKRVEPTISYKYCLFYSPLHVQKFSKLNVYANLKMLFPYYLGDYISNELV